jgi:uncharacterized membrane protein
MQEKAIVYWIVAWLACWLVDLIVIVARGPVLIDPILKLIIVLICLIVILVGLARHGWLWSG